MDRSRSTQFQLRYRSLLHHGRGYAFPCDARGQVELDALSEGARNNYFYAHAMVGKEMMHPVVEPIDGPPSLSGGWSTLVPALAVPKSFVGPR